MKARTLSIVAGALIAASTGAQTLYPIPTSGGYLHAVQLQQLAQSIQTPDKFPAPGAMDLGVAAPPNPPFEITGAAAVARYNEMVQTLLDVTRASLNLYGACMEQRIALASAGRNTTGMCSIPALPYIPLLGWREDTQQGGRK